MTTWNVTPLGDALDLYASIAGESLEYYDPEVWRTYVDRLGAENIRCVWDDQQMAGGVAFYRCGQWYGGNAVACAGVSGVAIEPSYRGSGACKHLLIETLRELHEERMPMASLYASTQHLYRSVGFEHSGLRMQFSLSMHALAIKDSDRELAVDRYVDPPIDVLDALANVRGARSNGNLKRTPGLWERIVSPVGGDTTSTYLIGGAENPQGFVVLVHGKRQNGHPQPLVATDWVANTPVALSRLIALVRDHRSMCDCFQWSGGPQDSIIFSAAEESLEVLNQLHTLNRIVHVPAALEARGYPTNVEGELHFEIEDKLLPGNAGRWILRIGDGKGSVSSGGNGTLRTTVRSLVPLYCGMFSCSQLVQLGRVESGSEAEQLLADQAFAGPSPWTSEIF